MQSCNFRTVHRSVSTSYFYEIIEARHKIHLPVGFYFEIIQYRMLHPITRGVDADTTTDKERTRCYCCYVNKNRQNQKNRLKVIAAAFIVVVVVVVYCVCDY